MVLSMERWKGKVAIVVGASSGIGAQITVQLLNEGILVVGMARRKEMIQQLSKSPNLHALKVDVTKEEEIVNAFQWVQDNLGPIHILINSIGILLFSNLIDGQMESWKTTINTDVLGLCVCTRQSIKNMRENCIDGHIIHVSGLSGHNVSVPCMSIVAACKTAITSLTESLRNELLSIGSKIKISSVSPGLVHTDIFIKNHPEHPDLQKIANELHTAEISLKTEDLADAVIYVLSTPPHVQVHNIQIRAVSSPY